MKTNMHAARLPLAALVAAPLLLIGCAKLDVTLRTQQPPGDERKVPVDHKPAALGNAKPSVDDNGELKQSKPATTAETNESPELSANALNRQHESLVCQVADLEHQHGGLLGEIETLNARLAKLSTKRAEQVRAIRQMDDRLNALSAQCDQHRAEIDRLSTTKAMAENNATKSAQRLACVRKECTELEAKIDQLNTERERGEQVLAESRTEADKVTAGAADHLAGLEVATEAAEQLLQTQKQKLQTLNAAVGQVQASIQSGKAALTEIDDQIKHRSEELDRVRRALEKAKVETLVKTESDWKPIRYAWLTGSAILVGVLGLIATVLFIVRRGRDLPWIVTATLHNPGGATAEREVFLEHGEGVDLKDLGVPDLKRPIDLIDGPMICRGRGGLVLDPRGHDVYVNGDPVTDCVKVQPGVRIGLPNIHSTTVVIESAHPVAAVPSALGAPSETIETLHTIGGAA